MLSAISESTSREKSFPVNKEKADFYYKKAADSGELQYVLEYAEFLQGRYDPEKAEKYYKEIIERDGSEEYILAYGKFLRGECRYSDAISMYTEYVKSESKSYAKCMFALAVLLDDYSSIVIPHSAFHPIKVRQYKREAYRLIKRAADLGDPKAIYRLQYYGIRFRKAKAKLVQKSAEAGGTTAMCDLVKKYRKKNPEEAFRWAKKAADMDCAEGISALAYCYEHGIGTSKKTTEAIQLYFKAQKKGSGSAEWRLKKLAMLGKFDNLFGGLASFENEMKIRKTAEALFYSMKMKDVDNAREDFQIIGMETSTLNTFLEGMITDISEYQKHCDQILTEAIENAKKDTGNYSKAQQELIALFGEHDWNRLLPESRQALISSRVILLQTAHFADLGFDYSGVSISSTAALEGELKRWFFDDMIVYLQKHYPNDYAKWPEVFKKYGKAKTGKDFTLGSFPYFAGVFSGTAKDTKEHINIIHTHTRNIMKEKLTIPESLKDEKIKCAQGKISFIDLVEDIRKNYRNPAGHTDTVTRLQAEECFKSVAGSVQSVEDASKQVDLAESALVALLDMLKE